MTNKNVYNTIHYIIAMLKAYKIKNIIASPGTQNSYFNSLVQQDSDFNCFSIIDERSAAYVATGLAYETQEPVVITCTGATASRNYLSALTEAYYKNLPIIALTFFDETTNKFAISAQYIDRSVSQNDIKSLDIELPDVKTLQNKKKCLTYLNAALFTAKYKKEPVHINCAANLDFKNPFESYPDDIWYTNGMDAHLEDLKNIFNNKNTAVFIGSHTKFSKNEELAISEFVSSWDIPVICDHTSNYHGKNKILVSQISYKMKSLTPPDIVIDIGGISGEYSSSSIFTKAKIWRIAEDNKFSNRLNLPVENLFLCREQYFFERMKNDTTISSGYYTYLKSESEDKTKIELPLSNGLVCQNLAKYIPANSSLHVSILNSLRNMNFFDLPENIDVNCNVGGFGIDGAVSTLFGQSLAYPNKLYFGIIGDLAFFYDMNILGNRHLSSNLRIILINNNRGEEFRLNPRLEGPLGDNNDILIAAGGHNKHGAKSWAESCGFYYMKAETKDEFETQIKDFCTQKFEQPVLFEVFTTDENEKLGLNLLKNNVVDCNTTKEKKSILEKLGNFICKK